MTADTVTTIPAAPSFQHGRLSDRIYVMHLAPGDLPGILEILDWLAEAEGLLENLCKSACFHVPPLPRQGLRRRGTGFRDSSGAGEDGYFAAKFLDAERRREKSDPTAVLAAGPREGRDARPAVLPSGWTCAPATEDDADDLTVLYREVFATYPFSDR